LINCIVWVVYYVMVLGEEDSGYNDKLNNMLC